MMPNKSCDKYEKHIQILPILIFVPIYNIPRFFEFESFEQSKYYCVDYLTENFTKDDLVCLPNANSQDEISSITCTKWHEETTVKTRSKPIRDEFYIKVSFFRNILLVKITMNVHR